MPKKPKYADYAELSAAFKSGELEPGYHIMIDKGGTSCSLRFYRADFTDEENDKRSDAISELFDECAHETPEALFEALCIPHQPA